MVVALLSGTYIQKPKTPLAISSSHLVRVLVSSTNLPQSRLSTLQRPKKRLEEEGDFVGRDVVLRTSERQS